MYTININITLRKLMRVGILTLIAICLFASSAQAYVSVSGYYRSDGTYVAPHVRSEPNGLKYDNYSWTSSQGLYNPTYGTRGTTWDTPTWITDPDYYEGKAIYDTKDGYSSLYNHSSSYTKPIQDVSYVTKLWVTNNPTTPCSESTFLRAKEITECEKYKTNINIYTWNETTFEYDGRHYVYDPATQITTSCPDGYSILYNTITGKPTSSCASEVVSIFPLGCTSHAGYSTINGLSCSTKSCSTGLIWDGEKCRS